MSQNAKYMLEIVVDFIFQAKVDEPGYRDFRETLVVNLTGWLQSVVREELDRREK